MFLPDKCSKPQKKNTNNQYCEPTNRNTGEAPMIYLQFHPYGARSAPKREGVVGEAAGA